MLHCEVEHSQELPEWIYLYLVLLISETTYDWGCIMQFWGRVVEQHTQEGRMFNELMACCLLIDIFL